LKITSTNNHQNNSDDLFDEIFRRKISIANCGTDLEGPFHTIDVHVGERKVSMASIINLVL
jgi:hypothetical protein